MVLVSFVGSLIPRKSHRSEKFRWMRLPTSICLTLRLSFNVNFVPIDETSDRFLENGENRIKCIFFVIFFIFRHCSNVN